MNIRLFVATPLLLALTVPAQVDKPAPEAKQKQPQVQPAPQQPATQEPVAAPKPKTLAEQLADLQAEKARLEQEIAYVRERAKSANKLLAEKLAMREQEFKAIDAGQSATARAMPQPMAQRKFARIATEEELKGHLDDAMVLVNGREITRGLYEQVMGYLRQSPSAADESLRAQRVLFDLIRIEAVAGAFPESEGEVRLTEVLSQLQSGSHAFTDLARETGVVQTATPDGAVEVTRNSIHGPLFEQIAFSTEPGSTARPFRNANGYIVLKVDSIEKGTTPQLDKVLCHAIQIPYSGDAAALQKAQFAVNAGQIEVLVRDQATLDLLPALFKPMAPRPAVSAEGNPRETIVLQLEAINAQIQKLESENAAVDALDGLKKERERLEAMLKAMPDMPKTDGDAAKPDAKPADPTKPHARPPVKQGEFKPAGNGGERKQGG